MTMKTTTTTMMMLRKNQQQQPPMQQQPQPYGSPLMWGLLLVLWHCTGLAFTMFLIVFVCEMCRRTMHATSSGVVVRRKRVRPTQHRATSGSSSDNNHDESSVATSTITAEETTTSSNTSDDDTSDGSSSSHDQQRAAPRQQEYYDRIRNERDQRHSLRMAKVRACLKERQRSTTTTTNLPRSAVNADSDARHQQQPVAAPRKGTGIVLAGNCARTRRLHAINKNDRKPRIVPSSSTTYVVKEERRRQV
mmetsp:Transcript_33964/g.50395  ORF Transcript_33964/g.50395 Transcript_33964/m.50395 type:complete len:249 (-) Transcript_33964:201-947(-)